MSILSSDQEDIAAFCSYAQLDASEYKVFERPTRSPRPRPQVSMESRNRRLLAAAPTEIPSPRPTDAGNRTLSHLGAPPALARIAVTSCAGGSGASTIAATLSRLFTIHGHSVLVQDSTRDRTISYFFGSRPVEQNILRTFMGDGDGRGALHLCFSAPEESAAQMARTVAMLRDELAWVITDCDRDHVPLDADLILAVCAPEPRSVVNAGAIRRAAPDGNLFFLLNNFDAASDFQQRMREQIAGEVGANLLPFAISTAVEFSEALSHKKTVLDFAPDAAVCSEFNRLAHWLTDYLTATSTQHQEVA